MSDVRILNVEQSKAVKHEVGPLLIIAGAGSGKTTVITERIKHLILKKNILPQNILALTFTEKAAREMEERVDIAMPYGYTQMWISTFHAFCDRILRNEAIHIGLNPSYKLTTEAESVMFLRLNLFKFDFNYFRPLGNPNKFLEGLLQHFSRLKDEDINPLQYLEYAKGILNVKFQISNKKLDAKRYPLDADDDEVKKNIELANAYKTYEDLKVKEGIMDFSDLISNTLKLFRQRKNILKNYQEQFKYILVDEFQDTNFAQNELAILLSGSKKNITVVGDDDQAIYRWRGAAISNIIQFRKHFPDAKVITLIKNYRSTKEILDKSYALIQNNNPDRLEVKEKVNKKLVSMRKLKGEQIEFLFAPRVEDEADLVAKKIEELTTSHAPSANYHFHDIAILVRANDHSQAFTRSLERHNIPFQFLGPGQLFKKEEIKDLIAYLKVLYNFEDSASLYRIMNMPIFKFEAIEIATLLNYSKRKNLGLFKTLEVAAQKDPPAGGEISFKEKTKEKIKHIFEMINKHLKRVPKDTAGQILYYFLQDTGLLKESLNIKSQSDEKKYQNIARFFEKLKAFEADHEDASIFAVVDWIDLSMQMGESPLAQNSDWQDINAVNILTIHSSKGLEFPIVFLVNLVTQRFPTRDRKEQIPIPQELIKEILPEGDYHLEEERRLFYVGATRARDLLFLTAANFYGEGKRERKISPFVYEMLGEKTVENQTLKQSNTETIKQLSLLAWSTPKQEIPASSFQLPASPPLTYLSYSQIQTFDICPLHYKLKYILKIPTPPSCAQSFGTSIHSALRDLYQNLIGGLKISEKELLRILENDWINEGYQSKAHEEKAYEGAKKIILNYFENNFNPKKIPAALETPFKFSLRRQEVNSPSLMVGGRIDRIDEIDNNKIEIIDYKTGNNVPDEKKLADDWQLTFYALAATEVRDNLLNKKPENVTLSLYYLEPNIKLTTIRTREQLEEAKKKILEKADEIANSEFKCSQNNLCKTCEYKILCNTS
ncbi:MAG: UvrD-helicase domain-containing protein [Candidatus Levyibacteriota bacterium]